MNAFNNTYFINAVNEVAKRYPQKDFCFNKKIKKIKNYKIFFKKFKR